MILAMICANHFSFFSPPLGLESLEPHGTTKPALPFSLFSAAGKSEPDKKRKMSGTKRQKKLLLRCVIGAQRLASRLLRWRHSLRRAIPSLRTRTRDCFSRRYTPLDAVVAPAATPRSQAERGKISVRS